MKKAILREAVRIAKSKLHLHNELHNYPHYSFIIQNNKIIEWATNAHHEPPRHYGYHNRCKHDIGYVPKFHAEVFAYKRAKALLTDNTFTIVNMRFNKAGQLKLSKPCTPCYELMSALGCSCFYYSSDIGFLQLKTLGTYHQQGVAYD